MNEYTPSPEELELFSRRLDQLVQTHQLPTGKMDSTQRDMLEIALTLTSKPFPSARGLWDEIRTPATNHVTPSIHRHITKRRLVTLGLLFPVAIYLVACAVSPTIRTQTKRVLFQIGHLVFTNEVTDAQKAEPYLNTSWPTPPIEETSEPMVWVHLSQEDASREAGFQVLVPHDVPEQEWERKYRPEWGNPKEISWGISMSPEGVVHVYCECFRFHSVNISQQKVMGGKLDEFAIDNAHVNEIEVRGSRGYWIEDAPTGIVGGGGSIWSLTEDDIIWQVTNENYLVWEEDGTLYIISGSDELNLEDFQLVAESLAP